MLKIEKVDSPFHIQELPLDRVYVIDDYRKSIWHTIDEQITNALMWAKTNQVKGNDSPTGLPHHSFGALVGSGQVKMAKEKQKEMFTKAPCILLTC